MYNFRQTLNKFWEELIASFTLILHGPHRRTRPTILLLHVYSLPHLLFTEPLSTNDKRLHIHTHRPMEGFMKYAVEMGSVAMINIRSFIKIGSGLQKSMGGDTQRHIMVISYAYLYFFKIRKVGLHLWKEHDHLFQQCF
jgi:hypothetical protein